MQAANGTDRVFALLGLAGDEVAEEAVLDIGLSCEQTYILTARVPFKHCHDTILAMCRQRSGSYKVLFWVRRSIQENVRQQTFRYETQLCWAVSLRQSTRRHCHNLCRRQSTVRCPASRRRTELDPSR
jgi:hypothetical protein